MLNLEGANHSHILTSVRSPIPVVTLMMWRMLVVAAIKLPTMKISIFEMLFPIIVIDIFVDLLDHNLLLRMVIACFGIIIVMTGIVVTIIIIRSVMSSRI